MPKKFKQSIQIDDHLTEIFRLPCVAAIKKINNSTFAVELRYVKDEYDNLRQLAFRGEWLHEDHDGNWFVTSDCVSD